MPGDLVASPINVLVTGAGGFLGRHVARLYCERGDHVRSYSRSRYDFLDQLGVEQAEVTKDASILDDLGADSLDVVELVMTLEDTFDIEVPDDAVEEMRTIGDVQRFVEARV